ncbi:MAG TPA: hypothetical protein DIW31_11595 [Bacteroidales bacterium]|nr:hypothetical protein [Bacteroidales bacterium]
MPTKKILLGLILIPAIALSCNSKPANTSTASDTIPKKVTLPYDTLVDNKVAFFSGMEHGNTECLSSLESTTKWKSHAAKMDSMFHKIESERLEKMRIWADSQLTDHMAPTTVFYPFSGPDFLNANVFFPKAENYIMIALEPIGDLPNLCNMQPKAIDGYLNSVNRSLSDIFMRSYFITMKMLGALNKDSVNGTVPLITLFIKRTGHNIISIKPIGVDPNGKWNYLDSLKGVKVTKGVKIDFVDIDGDKPQSVFYFKTDISNDGLNVNPGFRKYLSQLPNCYSYLKAASYLMQWKEFSMIRNTIFDKSDCILQDDSGIGYIYFDKTKWDIRLYGKYQKPNKEFGNINEPELAKAYKDSVFRPVPFVLGYNWKTKSINMLYAVKKGKLKLPANK